MRKRSAPLLAALAVLLIAAPAHAADYVGLGDSYSSGTGTDSSYADNCQRTAVAYPTLINAQLPGSGVNLSCSGARTQNITSAAQTPGNTVAQIDIPGGLGADTDFVTLQIGGNDAGFVDTLVECGNPFGDCDGAIEEAEQTALVELPPKLNATYDAVRAEAPNATIVVVGYPRIFRPNQSCNTFFSSGEVNDLNAAADLLSSSIKALAQARSLAYVDPRPVFIGHGACDGVEWVNGLSFTTTANSYHPKPAGHTSGYGPIVLAGIQNVPETTITSAPPSPSNSANPQFQLISSEPGSSFQCKLDAGSFAACSSPKQYTGLAQGSHTVQVRAVNANGDVDQFPASHTWAIDTTSPGMTLDPGGPTGTVATGEAAFTFSSADGTATVECKLDAGSFAACASPKSYAGLADGSHSFTVRATDAAGNSTTVARSWTVDTTAPHAAINLGPTDPTPAETASFEFSVDDPGAEAECRLDSADEEDFEPCTSPKTYGEPPNELSEGDHTFEVRGTDMAGNVGPVQSFAWTVDLTASTATITSGPPPLSNQSSASFEFLVDDEDAAIECSLDGAAFGPCDSPTSTAYTGLPDGDHEFALRATDLASHVAADSRTWTIDTAAPAATIESGPPPVTGQTSAELGFSSADPAATFECRLDSELEAAFAPCTSTQSHTGLADGAHRFDVRPTDPAGNTGGTVSRAWSVDTTPPAATISSGPAAAVAVTTAQFAFTSSEPGSSFECRLDSTDPGAFQPCASPQPYSGLGDGAHSFEVRATDAVGNTGAVDSHAWSVDTIAPQVSFDSGPDQISPDDEASFAFHASEPSSFECRLDSGQPGAFVGCASPKSYTGLADGPHTLEVRATDALGNLGPVAAYAWNADTLAPNVAIQGGPTAVSASNAASFTFSASEPGDFQCKLDGGAFAGCVSPQGYAALAEGPHSFQVKFTDAGGHAVTDSRSWSVDTVAPTVSIDPLSGPSGTVKTTSAGFSFTVSGGGPAQCRRDGEPFAPCASPKSFAALPEGPHSFEVRSSDEAGNLGSASRAWAIDLTAPQTTIDSAPPSPTGSGDASFAFSSDDAEASFQCSLDGAVFAACSSPAAHTGLGAGDHRFRVRALDGVGNVDASPASHDWTISSQAALGEVGAPAPKKPKCKRKGKKRKRKCAKKRGRSRA